MIPVDQTRTAKDGAPNCMAACLASIFEVPIEDVDLPELASPHNGDQWPPLLRICQAHGYQPFSYAVSGEYFPQIMPPGYHIACSDSHATVACGGHIVHDPHPRKSGLAAITEWILLFPIAREAE